ncbi:MAG TPA: hypothetical protein PLZ53_03765 [Candidatus Hydrogenedentes bacterium]|nr:MAG: hypothetical protein BWY07_00736 [Candidatus Hydrogenedentes bacterium ADurb.Bin170]HNZ48344.1 hypothetical protein [Candidatus Hydrogenedentota bacterium]HOD95538.1 hypothetical protein [Candidatus Hydrogenedentota bacterium]HOH42208.1 hypothetical protein [Candidatus Hydrogenedentota bacterium]HOM48395.1 hypothetical protein [Candidatus Hydrogenedentota bacterium]
MEDLLGFLIFIVIAVISVISRLAKEKTTTPDIEETLPRPFPVDELPEATRRMIYGDESWDIPVATPKGGGRTFVPPAEPRRPAEEHRRMPADEPRTVLPSETRPPVFSEPRQVLAGDPQTARRSLAPQEAPFRPAAGRPSPQPVTLQEVLRPAASPLPARKHQEPPRRAPRPAAAKSKPKAAPAVVTAAAPKRQETMRPAAAPRAVSFLSEEVLRTFSSQEEIRRALVLREILGPPRAFEEIMF